MLLRKNTNTNTNNKGFEKAPDSILAFCQHGFKYIPENTTGTQVYGKCPFCGHKEHKHQYTFYLNIETHRWDCKSCKREGGFHTFLEEIVALGKEHFNRGAAIRLQEDRGLSIKTLREWDIGYNPVNDTYLLPFYDANKTKLWNLYYWKKEVGIRGTATMLPGLYGWFNLKKKGQIWLCEGEWDAIALDEVLKALGKEDDVVIATPSAGTFKQEWTGLFKDRKVNVLYDNDEAGRGRYDKNGIGKGGMLLVHRHLASVAEDLKFIHWPEGYENGFDIRDLYTKKCERQPQRTLKSIITFLKPHPPAVELPEGVEVKDDDRLKKLTGEGMLHEEVYKAYEEHILVKDRSVIDLMYGAVIANRLPGDPIWLFMIAPPGGSKTEFIMSIDNAPLIYTLTSLSPKTLISGSTGPGGSDPSLLPQLDGRVLTIKDFTTILKQPKLDKDAIFGVLRDAYDGKIDWAFGNGLQKRYTAHFGIVAGVTPAIELETESDSILGERFLRYNMPHYTEEEEQREIIKRAIKNTANENAVRAALKEIGNTVLNYNFREVPELPDDIFEKIVSLAQWTAIMRGYVNRQRFTDLVTHKPFAEVGTRLAKQLTKLSMGVSMFRREENISHHVYNQIITKVARSTAPSRNEMVMKYLYTNNIPKQTNEIARAVGLPAGTIGIVLDNLVMLNALEKVMLEGIKSASYQLTKRMKDLCLSSEVYKYI